MSSSDSEDEDEGAQGITNEQQELVDANGKTKKAIWVKIILMI